MYTCHAKQKAMLSTGIVCTINLVGVAAMSGLHDDEVPATKTSHEMGSRAALGLDARGL